MKVLSSQQCLLILLGAALIPAPLMAQDDNAEARAEAIVDRLLEDLQTSLGELDFQINEDYELTQDDGTFTALFDEVSIGEDGASATMGPISVHITPGDDALNDVEFELPDAIVVYDGDDEVAQILIASASAEGIWSDTLGSFIENEVELTGLQLEVPEDTVSASLDSLSLGSSMSSEDDQSWNSDSYIDLQSMALGGPEGQSISIGNIRAEGEVSGSDFAQFLNLAQSLQELLAPEQLEAAGDDPSAVLSALGELFGYLETAEGMVTVSEVAVGQGDMSLGALASLSIGSEFSSDADSAAISYSIAFEGLETPVAPLPPQIVPSAMNFEIGLENIPTELVSKLVEVASASQDLSPAEQQAMMTGEVLGIVMASELGAYISETFIAAPESRIDLDLSARVSPNSPFSAAGELDLEIVGLDTTVQLAGLAQDPEIAPVLAMLTAFSDRSEENGQIVDRFAVEVTDEGKLMLNGKDMTAMLMGGGADSQ